MIFDIILVLCGFFLTPWAIIKWSELGFHLEPKFYAGNRDGSFFLIVTILGIAMISYGLFDFFVLRRGIKTEDNGEKSSIDKQLKKGG